MKYVHVEVTDISRSGLGFKSKADLEIGSYYDTRIQIWTKEVVDAVNRPERCFAGGRL